VALCFGLLHGFGLAGALRDVGLPQSAIPPALLSFNVGVEIGQLAFIGSASAVLRALRRIEIERRAGARRWATTRSTPSQASGSSRGWPRSNPRSSRCALAEPAVAVWISASAAEERGPTAFIAASAAWRCTLVGRVPAATGSRWRRNIRRHQGSRLDWADGAATNEAPHRLQNRRPATLPRPQSGQITSPGPGASSVGSTPTAGRGFGAAGFTSPG